MGRIGGWFKKSDDKEKPTSNPYAQQPPVTQQQPAGQRPPPPEYDQYGQYNGSQYNANQRLPHANQGAPSGLPSGPRPGGHPSTYAQGPPRTDTWDSKKSAPPRYNEQPDHTGPPPSYNGNPSLPSGGRSPALSSNQTGPSFVPNRGSPALSSTGSPSLGAGYPREKYGASDGVGANRFDPPATSRYDSPASLPPQRQGGYGGLDTNREALLGDYKGPSRQAFSPDPRQTGATGTFEQPFVDTSNMTEEERDAAEYAMKKAEADQIRNATEDHLDHSILRAQEARARAAALKEDARRQGEILYHANTYGVESELQAERSDLNVKDLRDATGSMLKVFTARSRAEKLNEEKRRQELEARQKRDEAQRLKREGASRAQQTMPPRPPQTLGAQRNAANIKNFALEEEDEVQEERIDGKLQTLGELVHGIHGDAIEFREIIDEQDPLIKSMTERSIRVQDNLISTQNRMNRIR